MKYLHPRLALMTGVSISAFALATPANAATSPGIDHNVTSANVDDTLTICLADDACNFGVSASGAGTVSASITDVASGEIRQVGTATGGDLILHMVNDGDTVIGAAATAASAAGAATALALIEPAIAQTGVAGGDVALDLTNHGNVLIDAVAAASGSHALAAATVYTAVHQFAESTGSGDASAAVTNDGLLTIGASAGAYGVTGATAAANVYHGIGNFVAAIGSGDALAAVTNAGDIAVSAHAVASVQGTSGAAAAIAFVGSAIEQTGSAASGDVIATIDNSGTIQIGAGASATAVTTAPIAGTSAVFASAQAFNSFAIDQTGSAGAGDVSLDIANSGSISISATAHAVAVMSGDATEAGVAFANAYMHDPLYQNAYAAGGDINLSIENDGEFDASLLAQATGAAAIAQARLEYGISQYASDAGGDAQVLLLNSGAVHETAAAIADGTAGFGFALASLTSAAFQLASAAGDANVAINNEGTFDAQADAAAAGVSGAGAGAFLDFAINQYAIASGAAAASLDNSGSINLTADAVADAGTGGATAIAFVSHGISQHAYGVSAADVSLTNNGQVIIAASGNATGDEYRGFGEAGVFNAIYQSASASGAATVAFANSGTVEISANAHGEGGQVGRAIAVIAPAIIQEAWGTAALATIDNSGKIDISAVANAKGGVGAPALADATGVVQLALSGTASLVNSGSMAVNASAKASATGSSAFVGVHALGILQVGHNSLNKLDNSGTFSVNAKGIATGAGGFEAGSATGYYVRGDGAELDVSNSGTLEVNAYGQAPNYARAGAIGIRADAIGGSAATSTAPAAISGSIVNDGLLRVAATAVGGGPLVTTTFSGATLTFDQSSAQAIGISMYVGTADASITNSGTIDVQAMTANGGAADAHAVWVQGNDTGLTPSADDLFTFINDGGVIRARESTDGGQTWRRGMAIDVATAPNGSVINLIGNGSIYGDIAVQSGDTINVTGGKTYFDGVINPAALPSGGVTSADLDTGLSGLGTLNIGNGGNLVLADPRLTGNAAMYDGPAYALIDTLQIAADGTLTYQLQPTAGGVQPVGSYPQIFADHANLDGTLVAELATTNGLFADSYSWDNVIDANVRTGTFDQCKVGGAYAGSPLLSFACSYDAGANVDLKLTRVAFDGLAGLTENQSAVGAGLEGTYDPSMTGAGAQLYADLFRISGTSEYGQALNQLSGSAYASYLQSFPSLGVHYNDLLDRASDCDGSARSRTEVCRAGPVRLWGQVDYQARKADGDDQAGTADAKRFTALFGADVEAAESLILGISGGAVSNHLRDRQFGDTIDADGVQAGAYAAYDPGRFFVKAMTNYSWFNGKSARHIDFTSLGGSLHGSPSGKPDVEMWSAGLHGGARVSIGDASVATPYVNFDYVHARLDAFSEAGLAPADLTVLGGKSNHTFVTTGAKWAANLDGVLPEFNLGYRHRFGDRRSTYEAAFLGDTPNAFDVVSSGQSRDTLLAGVSVGGHLGPVNLRIGYEGEFNGDTTSHSGNFKLTVPLGGHRDRTGVPAPGLTIPPPPPQQPAETVAPPAGQRPSTPSQGSERG